MSLEELRKDIDNMDNKIVELLAKRKDFIKKISEIKKEIKKPVIDEKREQQVIERIKGKAKASGLDEKFVTSLYNIILENSRNEQEK